MVGVLGRVCAPSTKDAEVFATVARASECLCPLGHREVSLRVFLDRTTMRTSDHRNGNNEHSDTDQKCVAHEQVEGDEM